MWVFLDSSFWGLLGLPGSFYTDTCMLSSVQLCDPMDCSLPGSLSMGFSRQEYWSGLPFLSPDLPNPGIKPSSPALAGGFFTTEQPGMLLLWISLMFLSVFSFCDTLMHTLIHLMVSHKSLKLSSLFLIFSVCWNNIFFMYCFLTLTSIFMTIILNSLSNKSLIFISLRSDFGDLSLLLLFETYPSDS